jgi:hypothetical protein
MPPSENPPKKPENPPKRPRHSARTAAEKAAREARVAEEMRQNLLKRKARQRAQREHRKPE